LEAQLRRIRRTKAHGGNRNIVTTNRCYALQLEETREKRLALDRKEVSTSAIAYMVYRTHPDTVLLNPIRNFVLMTINARVPMHVKSLVGLKAARPVARLHLDCSLAGLAVHNYFPVRVFRIGTLPGRPS
jgi:hypothetical protein